MKADLHMHSIVSDGDKSPKELVGVAYKKNVSIISLTDHDCVYGIQEARDEAKRRNIQFISGIELSCFDKKDTHVLGYGVDYEDKSFNRVLKELQDSRMSRMEKMVNLLRQDGFNVTMDEVLKKCNGQVMGRPHIGAVLVEKGYGRDTREVFNKYIGSGCKYYAHYKKLSVCEGIEIIHNAGGKAVLAHPKLLRYNTRDFTNLMGSYKKAGIDGIEVYYPCHRPDNIRLYSALAQELDLLMTCGGDYHNDYDKSKNSMGFDLSLPGVEKAVECLLAGEKQ